MDFIMHYCKKIPVNAFWFLLLSFFLGGLCGISPAQAGRIIPRSAEVYNQNEHFYLQAQFMVQLDANLENALQSGVPLVFVVEFAIHRPRWYWAYRGVASGFSRNPSRAISLSYHALTRRYRVTNGTFFQEFDTLAGALVDLGRVRNWLVLPADALNRRLDYQGKVRLFLDASQLPAPLQFNSLSSTIWQLSSEWRVMPIRFVRAP
jgi:hypothetical protein